MPRSGHLIAPRLGPKLALALAATLVGLLLAEGALRAWYWSRGVGRADAQDLLRQSQLEPREVRTDELFGVVQPSLFPEIIYEPRPRVHGTFRGQPYRTNAFGMRGPEVALAKPPGVFRLAAIGDSHMFGWGVGEGESYVDLLRAEGLHSKDGRRVEILNFACPGYNTAIEAAVYEHKVRRFSPDLVLLHYVGNDHQWPHFLQPPRSFSPGDWYVSDLVRVLLAPKGLDGELALLPHDPRETPPEERDAAESHYRYMVGDRGLRKAMNKLAALTSQDGVPVVVLMLGERQDALEIIEPLGFTWINAAPQYAEHLGHLGHEIDETNWKPIWDATYKIPDDGHPTVEAHVAYSEVLLEERAERGLHATSPPPPAEG